MDETSIPSCPHCGNSDNMVNEPFRRGPTEHNYFVCHRPACMFKRATARRDELVRNSS